MKLASALALVAVFLRVVLPLLHTHDHHALTASTHGDLSAVTVCSCGAVHAPSDRGGSGEEQVGDAQDGHHCLACELEVGTPCGCPPASGLSTLDREFAEPVGIAAVDWMAVSQMRLAQPRAPPGQQA